MHSIKLNIQDSVFDKVIFFLNNLPKDEVKIIGDIPSPKATKSLKLNSIKLHTKNFNFNREEANER